MTEEGNLITIDETGKIIGIDETGKIIGIEDPQEANSSQEDNSQEEENGFDRSANIIAEERKEREDK